MSQFSSLEYLGLQPNESLTCESLAMVLVNMHTELTNEKARREDLQEHFFILSNSVKRSTEPALKRMEDQLDDMYQAVQDVKSQVDILSQENDVLFGLFDKQTELSSLFSERAQQIEHLTSYCQQMDDKYNSISRQFTQLQQEQHSTHAIPSISRHPISSHSPADQTPKKTYIPKSMRDSDANAAAPSTTLSPSTARMSVIDPVGKKMLSNLIHSTLNQRMNPHITNSLSNAHDTLDKKNRPGLHFYSRAQLLTYRPSPQDTAQYIDQHDPIPEDYFMTNIASNITLTDPEGHLASSKTTNNQINLPLSQSLQPMPLLIENIPRYITQEHAENRGMWTGTFREIFNKKISQLHHHHPGSDDHNEHNMYPSQPSNIYNLHQQQHQHQHQHQQQLNETKLHQTAFNPHNTDKWSKVESRQMHTPISSYSRPNYAQSYSNRQNSTQSNYNQHRFNTPRHHGQNDENDAGHWRTTEKSISQPTKHSFSSSIPREDFIYDKYGKKVLKPVDKVKSSGNYLDQLHEDQARKQQQLLQLQSGLGLTSSTNRFDFGPEDDHINDNHDQENNMNSLSQADAEKNALEREKEQRLKLQQLWLESALAEIQSMLNKITSAKVKAFANNIVDILMKEDPNIGAKLNELQLSSIFHTILNRASKEASLVKTYAELCYLIMNNNRVKSVIFDNDESGMYSSQLNEKFKLDARFVIIVYSQFLLEEYTNLKSKQLSAKHFGKNIDTSGQQLINEPTTTIGIRVHITSPQAGRTFCRFLGELYKFGILPCQASEKALQCLLATGDEEDLLAAVDFLFTVLPSAMATHVAKVEHGVIPRVEFPTQKYATLLDNVKNTRTHVINLPDHPNQPISINIQMRTKFLIMDFIDAFNGKSK